MQEHADLDWSGLEILSDAECHEHLAMGAVGRIGFVDEGSPVILPVNYTLDGRAIVFRTAAGSKLSVGMMQRPVCFEVDEWDTLTHTGWSVLAKGVADEVLDDAEIARLETLPVRPWSRPDLRDHWVRIMVEELTGRRIGSSA
jgi:nitroimidazol reductase NimA-like FMN-containing flavoprotein (pyridoxamine 5'-phosphate oxidase superfamily)